MRCAILLLLAAMSFAATAADPPASVAAATATPSPLPAGYWVVDAVVRLTVDSKKNDEVNQVRRYVMKDPRPVPIGERVFLIGDGIIDWQVSGTVVVPIDTVVAMARFANNQEFARHSGGKDVVIGLGR